MPRLTSNRPAAESQLPAYLQHLQTTSLCFKQPTNVLRFQPILLLICIFLLKVFLQWTCFVSQLYMQGVLITCLHFIPSIGKQLYRERQLEPRLTALFSICKLQTNRLTAGSPNILTAFIWRTIPPLSGDKYRTQFYLKWSLVICNQQN